MAGGNQMTGQEPAPTPQLDDQTAPRTDGLEQLEDARSARVSVETETTVMDQGEVTSVVRSASIHHECHPDPRPGTRPATSTRLRVAAARHSPLPFPRYVRRGVGSTGDIRVGSVVIDCTSDEFERMVAFWSAALGYVPRDEPDEDWIVLRDPLDRGVNVSLRVVPEPRAGKNRPHLDLSTPSARPRWNASSVSAPSGSRGHRSRERTLVTLVDPGGTPFDVIQKETRDRMRDAARHMAGGSDRARPIHRVGGSRPLMRRRCRRPPGTGTPAR